MDAVRYQPSYRLQAKNPYNREICEIILKQLVDKEMKNYSYNPREVETLCNKLCENIKSAVKLSKFDRYKLICVVSIGEKFMQDVIAKTSFLWDSTCDGFASYIYETPDFYLIATIYSVYYD